MTFTLTRIAEWRSHDDTVQHIQLNAPKANILDGAMTREILSVLESAGDRPSCKLIVFEAAGPHFSFGARVQEHLREQAADMLTTFHGLFLSLMDLAIPCLAAVQGQCLGGGFELATFCHFILAEETAVFGVPEIKLGVFPPPASAMLPLRIGQARAEDLILTGRSVTAAELQTTGLLESVVPAGSLPAAVDGFIAEHISTKSASSLRQAVRAARRGFDTHVRAGLADLQAQYLEELMATHDANEGIQAFLEKREPNWKHE